MIVQFPLTANVSAEEPRVDKSIDIHRDVLVSAELLQCRFFMVLWDQFNDRRLAYRTSLLQQGISLFIEFLVGEWQSTADVFQVDFEEFVEYLYGVIHIRLYYKESCLIVLRHLV